jgi:hypothetical protein
MSTKTIAVVPSVNPIFNPQDLLPIEEVARRLHADPAWVREKVRRRCSNPIPVYNLGRHLLFDWTQVSAWIRSTPRPIHAAHRRRTKAQIEVTEKKSVKKAA